MCLLALPANLLVCAWLYTRTHARAHTQLTCTCSATAALSVDNDKQRRPAAFFKLDVVNDPSKGPVLRWTKPKKPTVLLTYFTESQTLAAVGDKATVRFGWRSDGVNECDPFDYSGACRRPLPLPRCLSRSPVPHLSFLLHPFRAYSRQRSCCRVDGAHVCDLVAPTPTLHT